MFGRNKNRPVTGRIDTLIAKQTVIDGDVSFQGGMHLEGRVRGSVRAMPDQKTTLWVGEGGRIDGDVVVADLVVDGEIRGQVHATGRAVIGAKARIVGDLHYRSIETVMGARIEGKLIPIGSDAGSAPALELSAFDPNQPRT
jgi:cytoskeletal protein CcmA (bactofilin family)